MSLLAGRVMSSRDMRVAVPARAVSVFGDSVAFIALSVRVAESGEPARLTAVLLAFAVPVFAVSGWAGRLVDEHDSRRLLVAAGLVQVAGSAGLVWGPNLPVMLGFLIVLQVGQSVTGPTWGALVPCLVGEALVGRAVAIQQTSSVAAGLAGTAVGGILFDKLGYHWTMTLDTISFTIVIGAAAAVRTRRGRRYEQAQDANPDPREQTPAPAIETMGGFAFIREDPLLSRLVPTLWVFVLAAEGTNVVEVFLVTQTLHATATMFGIIGLCFAAGAMLGPVTAARFTDQRRQVFAVAAAAAALGVLLAAAGLAPDVRVLAPIYLLAGFSNGVITALVFTLIAVRTPGPLRGRVLASLNGSARGFTVLALLLGGLGGQYVGPRATFVIGGCLAATVAIPLLRVANRTPKPSPSNPTPTR